MSNGPVRVALYARASSDHQEYSAPGQFQDLRVHAAEQGFGVVEEVSDVNEKRHDLTRPGLEKLRDLAEAGAIDEVWAWAWDRYGEMPVPEVLAVEMRDFGVELRSLDDNGGGEDGEDMQVIKSLFSRREQRTRVRRANRGRADKTRRGQVFGGFRARYGFRFIEGTNQAGRPVNVGYEADPERMPHVWRIFQMVADGVGLKGVRREFEQAGVPNPSGGPRWSTTTIKGIVNDDVYRPHGFKEIAAMVPPGVAADLDAEGVYGVSWSGRKRSKFASSRGKKRTVYETPREQWTAIPIPLTGSGLDRGVVDRARARVEGNRSPSKAGDRVWELSGVAKCAECGRNLIAYRRAKKGGGYNTYYRCRPSSTVDVCENRKSHPADALENLAWVVFGTTADPEKINALYDDRENRQGVEKRRRQAAVLMERLSELEQERRGYLRQNARGKLLDADLDAMLSEVDEQREKVSAELTLARDATATREETDAMLAAFLEFRRDGEFLYNDSPEDRLRAYKRLGVRFDIEKDGALTASLSLGGEVLQKTPTML